MQTNEWGGFYIERFHPDIVDARYVLKVYAPSERDAILVSKLLGKWPYSVAVRLPEGE